MLASANQYGEPAQFQIEKEESPIVRRRSFRDACIQSASRTGRSAAGSGEAAFSGSLVLKRDRQGQTKDKNLCLSSFVPVSRAVRILNMSYQRARVFTPLDLVG